MLVRRRLRLLLDDVGVPKNARSIFSGDVTVESTRYAEALKFGQIYVEHYKDSRP